METEIIINRKTKAEIEKLPVNDGNIYFSTDSNEIFMDNGKSRKSYGNDKQEIENLKNEVKKNKEDVSVKLESKGNPIILKDSADSPVINLELNGSTIQENIPSLEKPEEIRQGVWDRINCTGKNLFNYLKAYEKCKIDNGVINDYGGSILNIKNKIPKMLTGKTVTISALLKTTSVINTRIRVTRKDGTYLNSNFIKNNGFYNLTKITFKAQQDDIFQIAYSEGGSTGIIEVKDFQMEVSEFYTQYEPYKGFTKVLSETIQLSEWDRIRLIDGAWEKDTTAEAFEFDGSEDWRSYTFKPGVTGFYIEKYKIGIDEFETFTSKTGFCNMFKHESMKTSIEKNGDWYVSNNNTFNFAFDGINNVEDWKKMLQKTHLKGIAKTKKTKYEILSQEIQDVLNKIVTFYPSTVISTNEGITVDLEYFADAKKYIDNNYVLKSEYNDLLNRVETLEKNVINK